MKNKTTESLKRILPQDQLYDFTSTTIDLTLFHIHHSIIICKYKVLKHSEVNNHMELDLQKYTELAEMLKALAHPVRLCIVKGLIDKGECNVTHMQNCLNMPQSTVSQNLQKLKAANIIMGVRTGLEINYRIRDQRVVQLVNILFDKSNN